MGQKSLGNFKIGISKKFSTEKDHFTKAAENSKDRCLRGLRTKSRFSILSCKTCHLFSSVLRIPLRIALELPQHKVKYRDCSMTPNQLRAFT
ncbi:hypothetical protein L596_015469 [Steinernema carpocapsae]|uniref:Uncharacterized protein n=1 Tax=Steinernema carpocapsae TaxID=34508 RepID=A0A4U5NF19_STECR|nr:hypothetical protein L596_015469 [Steinernema carpocapsae]